MDVERYRRLVRPLVAGRRWIFAGAPLAAVTRTVRLYRDLGSERILVVATSLGTGDLPSEEDAEWVSLDIRASSMMEGFRKAAALVEDPPPSVREAVDRYDPERQAMVAGSPFITRPEFHGRPVYGYRRPEWVALEDKVVVDDFWEQAGVARPPSEVVPAEGDALRRAARRLDRGLGTIWQGDAWEGFNGGAEYLRWVRTDEDAAEAESFFGAHCRMVRVTPFQEGIPCSVHGMVFPEAVIAFRPVEILTLRQVGTNRLRYSGTATFWDPADEDRAEMRSAARRVGEALRERVDYRGAFTVDGIMTEVGFRPTELNTRAGAGLAPVVRGLPELPFSVLNMALVAGERLDYRPHELEAGVTEAADRSRSGGGYTVVPQRQEATDARPVVQADEGYRPATEEETPDAELALGPSDVGGMVRFEPVADRVPPGSLAGRAVAGFALADRLWDTGIGPLEAPRPVR